MQFPDHGLNRLNERLILFKHEYHSENMLLPINVASDVTEGALVEIVVSGIHTNMTGCDRIRSASGACRP